MLWPEVLPHIQSLLNNTSSLSIGKTPNEIAYDFSPHKPLDLFSNPSIPSTFQARTNAADVISFALANQKAYYNQKQQSLFIKVGNWAILRLHQGYSIIFLAGVTKKFF